MGEYYGAQFISQGFNDFNNALARAFDLREKKKEELKRQGQLTASIRKTLDLLDPEGKDARAAQGLFELQGELTARGVKSAEKERAYRERESVARTALDEEHLNALIQQHAQQEAAGRFYGELNDVSAPPAPLNEAAYGGELARGSRVTPQMVFGALQRSGYAPGPEKLDQLLKALAPAKSLNQIPVESFGTPKEVPGMPGHYFVPTSTGGGQILQRPGGSGATGEPQEVSIGGKSTGWGLFPDGKYRILHGKRDMIDAAEFDADGDGVISAAEFAQAAMASKFKGEVWPGMRVQSKTGKAPSGKGEKKINPKDPLGLFE
jgi:hypothetical protein